MNECFAGETRRLYINDITSSSGAIVDPTAITLAYWLPNTTGVGVATTSAAAITYISSGNYYADIATTTSQAGICNYRWQGTGDAVFKLWGAFKILNVPKST